MGLAVATALVLCWGKKEPYADRGHQETVYRGRIPSDGSGRNSHVRRSRGTHRWRSRSDESDRTPAHGLRQRRDYSLHRSISPNGCREYSKLNTPERLDGAATGRCRLQTTRGFLCEE